MSKGKYKSFSNLDLWQLMSSVQIEGHTGAPNLDIVAIIVLIKQFYICCQHHVTKAL